MTMTNEKKGKKRSSKNEGHKSSKKPFLEEDVENKILAEVDQEEIDEVLAAQEFPMQKVSKKKKKESKVIKEETEPTDDSNDTPPAIDYLLSWKSKDKDWKFKKLRQTWLLQNMYDKEKVRIV